MHLKKSALLLIILSVSSVSLLVFSAATTPLNETVIPLMPAKCPPANCRTQRTEPKTYAPWDMISQIIFRSAA